MSKHNYTQYSNKAAVVARDDENRERANAELEIGGVVEPIPTATPVEPVVVEETVDTVALPETVPGVVVNCSKLNVRAEPSISAEVVCVLDSASEIEINVTKSTDEWFYACTAAGVEGYCMRKFVNAHL